jgi:GxxExxY protein
MGKEINNLLYKEDSYKIRGACFEVYNTLGGGIKEKIIHRALNHELENKGLAIQNESRIDIFYKNEKVGVYIPDIIVNEKIIIEIKSKPYFTREDKKQFWGYLKGSKYKLGFLINFGPKELLIKRYIHR